MADTFPKASISTEAAHRIIAAAEAKASEMGTPMVIAVVDDGGVLKAFSRMDGAALLSVPAAYAAASTPAWALASTPLNVAASRPSSSRESISTGVVTAWTETVRSPCAVACRPVARSVRQWSFSDVRRSRSATRGA